MILLPDELANELFTNPLDKLPWGDWKECFKEIGIKIDNEDAVPFTDSGVLNGHEARAALESCIYVVADSQVAAIAKPKPAVMQGPRVVLREPEPKITIVEWRRRFQELLRNPPINNFYLRTIDGSPLRLEVELYEGRPPFIFTRAYIPQIVGSELGWFGQKKGDKSMFGWKVILLPNSRDETIKRLGIATNEIYVQTIKILKLAETKKSLLGEVCQWLEE